MLGERLIFGSLDCRGDMNTPLLTLDVPGLTRADQHCIALDIKMTIGIAKNLPASEREAYLKRQRFSGPHKSGMVDFSADAIEHILAHCEAP